MKYIVLALLLLSSAVFAEAPSLNSRYALVINNTTDEVILSKNMEIRKPIASITKLMTAIIVLDANQSMTQPLTVTIRNIDRKKRVTSRLPVGVKYTREELLLLALMSSENRAANTLANNYPKGYTNAIAQMNKKAKQFGMTHTTFRDATGLSAGNVSTAADLSKMVKHAYSYPTIVELTTNKKQELVINKRPQTFNNTNPLIHYNHVLAEQVALTKTGYTKEAGRCIVMLITTMNNTPITVVLMNAQSSLGRTRDINNIINWVNESGV